LYAKLEKYDFQLKKSGFLRYYIHKKNIYRSQEGQSSVEMVKKKCKESFHKVMKMLTITLLLTLPSRTFGLSLMNQLHSQVF
jgi:hypothetical protein